MPLTGVQYREKFVEETIHRIVYQCTRDRVEAVVIYHAPGRKISRFMDRGYINSGKIVSWWRGGERTWFDEDWGILEELIGFIGVSVSRIEDINCSANLWIYGKWWAVRIIERYARCRRLLSASEDRRGFVSVVGFSSIVRWNWSLLENYETVRFMWRTDGILSWNLEVSVQRRRNTRYSCVSFEL